MNYLEFISNIIRSLIWPGIVILVVFIFRPQLNQIFDKFISGRLKIETKYGKIVCERINEKTKSSLSKKQLEHLMGLDGNDIWFLSSFGMSSWEKKIERMNPSSKVMAIKMIENGFVEVIDINNTKELRLTYLGNKVLDAAKGIEL